MDSTTADQPRMSHNIPALCHMGAYAALTLRDLPDMGQRCAELVMCDILAQLARSRSGQGLAAAKWRSHQRTP